MIAATLAAAALLAAAPPPPTPDPPPGTKGPITYVDAWYWTKDARDGALVLCYVPAIGKRTCVRFTPYIPTRGPWRAE